MIRDAFLKMLSTRALDRVNPDWVGHDRAELGTDCAARRKHREAERVIHQERTAWTSAPRQPLPIFRTIIAIWRRFAGTK